MATGRTSRRLTVRSMTNNGKKEWFTLREYLMRLSSCQTPDEFMHGASEGVQSLIPFDTSAGIFGALDGKYLKGIGHSDAVVAAYNTYYRTRQPLFLVQEGRMDMDRLFTSFAIDWRKLAKLEYATDFVLPNRMCKSLSHPLPGNQITLAIQRSASAPDFSEHDADLLGVVNEHLNNFFSALAMRSELVDLALSPQAIAERFRQLSHREAEICSLVAHRLNTSEIATKLFIGARTVEKHVESIFDKLDVRSREQLRWKLGVTPPTRS